MGEIIKPMDIEKESFRIISEELGETNLGEKELLVLKRVIHTTADFEYKNNLKFNHNPVEKGIELLKNGCVIVTDTTMALSGISKPALKKGGNDAYCFISDDDVISEAKERGITRAQVAMEKAAKINKPLIIAVGNAPTALIKLDELIKADKIHPELIIACPVGFVNVVESKELILKHNIASIVSVGRNGGSNVAADIINAMLYQAFER